MSLRQANDGITGDTHRLQLFFLVGRLRIIEIIELTYLCGNLLFEIEHSFPIDLTIHAGMSRCTLFHKFGEDTRFIGSHPVRREMGKNAITL